MGTYSFLRLAAEPERAFEFLGAKCFHVRETRACAAAPFRGGFVLRLVGPDTIALSYLELRLKVIPNELSTDHCLTERRARI
jgi:hypothetical protein